MLCGLELALEEGEAGSGHQERHQQSKHTSDSPSFDQDTITNVPQKTDEVKLAYISEVVGKAKDMVPQLRVESLKTKGKEQDTLQYKKFPKEAFHAPVMRITFNDDKESSCLLKLQNDRVTAFYDLVGRVEDERFYVDEWDLEGLKWMNGRVLMDSDVLVRWSVKEGKGEEQEAPAESGAAEEASETRPMDAIYVIAVSEDVKFEYLTDPQLQSHLTDPEYPEDVAQLYTDNDLPTQATIMQEVYEAFARTDVRPVRIEDKDMRVLLTVPLENAAQRHINLHLPRVSAEDKVEQIIIAYKKHDATEENVFQRISSTLPVYLREKVLEERLSNPNSMQIQMEHNARLLSLHEESGVVLGGQVIVVEFNVVETREESCQVGDQISMWFRRESQGEEEDGEFLGSQETHGQTYSQVRFRLLDEAGSIYFTYLQRGAPDASNWIYRTESFSTVPKENHAENELSEMYRKRCKELQVKLNSLILKRLRAGTFCNAEGEINLESDYLSRRGFVPVIELIGEAFGETCKHLNLRGNGLRNAEVVLLCERLSGMQNLESIDLRDNVISTVETDEESVVFSALRDLLTYNRRIVKVDLRGTKICDAHKMEIEKMLHGNAQEVHVDVEE